MLPSAMQNSLINPVSVLIEFEFPNDLSAQHIHVGCARIRWACSTEGREVWCVNPGPKAKVAEVLSQWLAAQDCDEGACDEE